MQHTLHDNAEQELFALFEQLDIPYTNTTHEPVFTADEASFLKAKLPGAHCKNLFLKNKKDQFFLVVMLDSTRLDLKQFQKQYELGHLSFANDDYLMHYLGIKPGSVCPFAVINDTQKMVRVILDEEMMQHEQVNYHPLRNDMTVTISNNDLIKFFDYTGHEYSIEALPKK
ncbi:MAG: prolyl-tRNA synthetase associated domain-containing protein [Epsilonproteobacteria bacterium]|nr:prolyl-tRNA synthetase associated domain-containing protein [Campylobacterota bacterium]